MTTFDSEAFPTKPVERPFSFENQSHLIMRRQQPIEIDLDQPDRADEGAIQKTIGFEGGKLIAEIKTPKHRKGLIHVDVPQLDPILMLIDGSDIGLRKVLDAGKEYDLSDTDGDGRCILKIDESGHHAYVFADTLDAAYSIFTKELEQYAAPSADEYNDDPES